jgi:hypothetical protein
VDAAGTPVVGANIVLEVASLADDPFVIRYDRRTATDVNGAFELVRLPPDDYVLGLNIDPHFENMPLGRGLPGHWVSPRVFHPGSYDLAAATRITLGGGEKRVLPPMRLPDNLVVRAITGVARWPDGNPVSEGWISLHDADTKILISAIVRTSSSGQFDVAGFAGQRLFITVETKDGDRKGYAESAPIALRPETAATAVVLTVTPR